MKFKLMMLFIFLKALVGCGEDASQAGGNSGGSGGNTITGRSADLSTSLDHFKHLCVDDNLPRLALDLQQCIDFNTTYGTDPAHCHQGAAVVRSQLDQEWDSLETSAHAQYNLCMADFRTTDDLCVANYGNYLSLFVSQCESVVITHFY